MIGCITSLLHGCVLEKTDVFPKCSRLELIYLRNPSSSTGNPRNPNITVHISILEVWYGWEVQPKCTLESGLKQSAFQQTDTPIKHALSEACCVVSLLWIEHSRVACRLSLLPFRISAHPSRHTWLLLPRSTHCCSRLFKAAEAWLTEEISLCYASSRESVRKSRALPQLYCYSQPLLYTFTWRSSSVTSVFGEAEPQRLVCLSAAFQCSRAGPSRQSSTCKDRKCFLVCSCYASLHSSMTFLLHLKRCNNKFILESLELHIWVMY